MMVDTRVHKITTPNAENANQVASTRPAPPTTAPPTHLWCSLSGAGLQSEVFQRYGDDHMTHLPRIAGTVGELDGIVVRE